MADISKYLAQIMSAVYGRDVRSSIHNAIDEINKAQEVAIDSGTDINPGDPVSSTDSDRYKKALYINTSTNRLLRCNGTTWEDIGSIKGTGISSITGPVSSGLLDEYTIHYTDGTTSTYSIKNGNQWYFGTAVSGKNAVTPLIVTLNFDVRPGDSYLNISEDAIYHCTSGAPANMPSEWLYDFTITSSSTGTNDYQMLINRPAINGVTLSGNKTADALGLSGDAWLMDTSVNPPVPLKKTMLVDSTSVTFTAAEMADIYSNGWAAKAYFNVADGQPAPAFKKAIKNAVTGDFTIYYTKVKSAQAGLSGNECWCQLRIVK